MNRRGHRSLASCALPLVLALAAQGGSCRDGGADEGRRAGQAAPANARTSDRGAPADAAGTTNAEAPTATASNANAPADAASGAGGRGGETMAGESAQSGGVKQGGWGGRGVRLEVKENGADVEFDCGHGTMPRLVADAAGNFDVRGTYVAEHGGPVRHDEQPGSRPARYSGRVEGSTMTMRVTVEGHDEPLEYTLAHGRGARLHKCL
jgi:hypothetical protein